MPVEARCENCGQIFYCYQSDIEAGRKYCSLACRSSHRFGRGIPPLSKTPVNFTCKECSKPFIMMRSFLTAYRKRFGHDPLYCSMNCSNIGRRKDADERNKFTCQQCGKTMNRNRKPGSGGRIYREQKYCSYECKVEAQKFRALKKFQAGTSGRHIKQHGYVWLSVPSLVTGKKHEILEHRYIMQQKLGRALYKHETVHHINGNRQDNRIENLELRSNRHGPGQRVIDKVTFAVEMLCLYPEFLREEDREKLRLALHL